MSFYSLFYTYSLFPSIFITVYPSFCCNPAPTTVFKHIPYNPAYPPTVYTTIPYNPADPPTVYTTIPYNPAYPPTVYTTIPYNPADPPTAPVHHVLLLGVYNYSLNNPFLNTQHINLQSVHPLLTIHHIHLCTIWYNDFDKNLKLLCCRQFGLAKDFFKHFRKGILSHFRHLFSFSFLFAQSAYLFLFCHVFLHKNHSFHC